MQYVELSSSGTVDSHSVLCEEIANTKFVDGILLIASALPNKLKEGAFSIDYAVGSTGLSPKDFLFSYFKEKEEHLYPQSAPLYLYLFSDCKLSSSEFGADYTCCHGYVKRL